MKRRHWIAPALLALPFVVALGYDVYRAGSKHEIGSVDLLAGGGERLEFVSADLVLDLRARPPSTRRGDDVAPDLDSNWGEATPQGRWTVGNRAALSWPSAGNLQRAMFLEARVSRTSGPPPRLLVAINGRSCGVVKVTEKMGVHLVELAAGQILVGRNSLDLELVDRDSTAGSPDRKLLLRRIGFTADSTGGFPTPFQRKPLTVDPDSGSVVVRRAGRITVPFEVLAGGSSLSLRYRFRDPEPGAQARVVVGRRYEGPDRFDIVREWTLRPGARVGGRLRQTLRDRGERGVVFVDVNSAAADRGFVLREVVVDPVP